ncbi:HNH endonuclease signature motif containing protein [Microbacterium sp. SMR1]|uniref:HNH endonuclease signature motif containing protein n=1 Tax=Microbacterium sp. SMR1 TaxID=1497340 RepID=UPI00215CF82B|nr:HNH endonuclease signature motif containing protein [Microbacterium sp. SMR1]
MHSNDGFRGAMDAGMGSDSDVDALAMLVADAEGVSDAARAVQIREVRVLAAAGVLAEKQAAGASEKVKAREMALRGIAAELAGVFVATDRTLQRRIDEARDLVDNYPLTMAAWETGRIVRGHVRVIQEIGCLVPADDREDFERAAIERCEGETPNRVRAALQMLAERMHPRTFTERHEEAAAGRCVQVRTGADGMSDLIATLPTVIADGIVDRLTRQAREIIDARAKADAADAASASADAQLAADATGADGLVDHAGADGSLFVGDARTIDQVRADVFSDLLLAGRPALDPTASGDGDGTLGAIRAHVQVAVSALTLMGKDEGPADLAGRSPVDAATARELAGNSPSWDRLLTHPVTGTVLECDSYRPTAAMVRLLRARDRHCRFPGCRQPAIRCELDHTIAASDGGATHVCNLANLCKRHHDVKHHTRWQVRQLSGGRLIWTSPTGRIYREDAPPPVVAFTVAVTTARPPDGRDDEQPPGALSPPPRSGGRLHTPFGSEPPF